LRPVQPAGAVQNLGRPLPRIAPCCSFGPGRPRQTSTTRSTSARIAIGSCTYST
jgi:hypothetical protein